MCYPTPVLAQVWVFLIITLRYFSVTDDMRKFFVISERSKMQVFLVILSLWVKNIAHDE